MKRFSTKIEDNFYFNKFPLVTSKFMFLYKLGFKRIVLSRELSLNEIEYITSQNTIVKKCLH